MTIKNEESIFATQNAQVSFTVPSELETPAIKSTVVLAQAPAGRDDMMLAS